MNALATIGKHGTLQVPDWLFDLLDDNDIPYEVIHHKADFTAVAAAADTGTRRLEFAKTIVVQIADRRVMAVLPAHHRIDLDRIAEAFGGGRAWLVPEPRLLQLFPDCEVGAMPPFGFRHNLPEVVAAPMALDEYMTFNAGSHEMALRIRFADYERLVQPRIVNFSYKQPL